MPPIRRPKRFSWILCTIAGMLFASGDLYAGEDGADSDSSGESTVADSETDGPSTDRSLRSQPLPSADSEAGAEPESQEAAQPEETTETTDAAQAEGKSPPSAGGDQQADPSADSTDDAAAAVAPLETPTLELTEPTLVANGADGRRASRSPTHELLTYRSFLFEDLISDLWTETSDGVIDNRSTLSNLEKQVQKTDTSLRKDLDAQAKRFESYSQKVDGKIAGIKAAKARTLQLNRARTNLAFGITAGALALNGVGAMLFAFDNPRPTVVGSTLYAGLSLVPAAFTGMSVGTGNAMLSITSILTDVFIAAIPWGGAVLIRQVRRNGVTFK